MLLWRLDSTRLLAVGRHIYLSRAAGFTANASDVETFSDGVLEWWRRNGDSAILAWVDHIRNLSQFGIM